MSNVFVGNAITFDVADPGANGTFSLPNSLGVHFTATIASGTRKLPDNRTIGCVVSVPASGAVTITNQAGATVATLAANEVAKCVAISSTVWVAVVLKVGATG